MMSEEPEGPEKEREAGKANAGQGTQKVGRQFSQKLAFCSSVAAGVLVVLIGRQGPLHDAYNPARVIMPGSLWAWLIGVAGLYLAGLGLSRATRSGFLHGIGIGALLSIVALGVLLVLFALFGPLFLLLCELL